MDGSVWFKTGAVGNRPPLGKIVGEAKTRFETNQWDTSELTNIGTFAEEEGNPIISKEIDGLTAPQKEAYSEARVEVFRERCAQIESTQKPIRPSILEIVERAKQKFTKKGWPTTRLDRINSYVEKKGNDKISSHLGNLTGEQRTEYTTTVKRVFAASCGYEEIKAPSVTGSVEIKAGETKQVTLKGADFIEGSTVVPADSLRYLVKIDSVAVNQAKDEISFRISADAKTPAGQLALYIAPPEPYISQEAGAGLIAQAPLKVISSAIAMTTEPSAIKVGVPETIFITPAKEADPALLKTVKKIAILDEKNNIIKEFDAPAIKPGEKFWVDTIIEQEKFDNADLSASPVANVYGGARVVMLAYRSTKELASAPLGLIGKKQSNEKTWYQRHELQLKLLPNIQVSPDPNGYQLPIIAAARPNIKLGRQLELFATPHAIASVNGQNKDHDVFQWGAGLGLGVSYLLNPKGKVTVAPVLTGGYSYATGNFLFQNPYSYAAGRHHLPVRFGFNIDAGNDKSKNHWLHIQPYGEVSTTWFKNGDTVSGHDHRVRVGIDSKVVFYPDPKRKPGVPNIYVNFGVVPSANTYTKDKAYPEVINAGSYHYSGQSVHEQSRKFSGVDLLMALSWDKAAQHIYFNPSLWAQVGNTSSDGVTRGAIGVGLDFSQLVGGAIDKLIGGSKASASVNTESNSKPATASKPAAPADPKKKQP
ncbi:MAG: hypothetical protein WC632_02110 [Candidatus Margulisiibacteriota bacterium]